jgi:hypothetical protein
VSLYYDTYIGCLFVSAPAKSAEKSHFVWYLTDAIGDLR